MTELIGSGLLFVFVLLLVGLTVLLLVLNIRRTMGKDDLQREEMTVYFPPLADGAKSPLAAQLSSRLAALGYSLREESVDPEGKAAQPVATGQALIGARIRYRRQGERRKGVGVTVAVFPLAEAQARHIGLVDIAEHPESSYSELGQFIVAALGELFPGLHYKLTYSELDEEPVEKLRSRLPERPIAV